MEGFQTQLIPPEPGTGGKARERVIVTRDQLAEVLGLKAVTINALVTDGMPRHAHGRYDLAAAVQWYIETWRKRVDDLKTAGGDTSERKRYDAARARQAELQLAERERQLVPAEEVARVLTRVASMVVSTLEALPARRATELAQLSEPGPIQSLLTEDVHSVRQSIADAITAFGATLDDGRADAPAAKTKRRRVGRRKAAAA